MTTRLHVNSKSTRASHVLAAALLLGSAAVAGAQDTQVAADGRWTAWVGCWQASGRDASSQELAPDKPIPTVCIAPATATGAVDLVTVGGTATPITERVDANGTRRIVNREGCNGWETAAFSADGKRIYLRSEYQCTGSRTRTSTGIMSISPNGEWLDVQSVKVASHTGVRVVHYRRVPVPALVSADIKTAIERQTGMATSLAVVAAGDSVRIADVVDASKHADPLVVQTWLAQRGQGFGLDAKRLTQLADAKVPANVIDVMVALSYPGVFAVNLAQADGRIVQTNGVQVAAEESLRDGPTAYMDWDPFYSSTYGYNRYGYGYGSGLGYNGYYLGSWYQGGTTVIVTRPSDAPKADTRGKMVRGSGYTRPDDRSGGSSSGSPRSSTSGGSGSGSSSTGSSSTGSSGGSEPRTAKPRSP